MTTPEPTTAEVVESIKVFISAADDWARAKTKQPGVFYRQMRPSKKSGGKPTAAVNINPVDASGTLLQRNGLNVRSVVDLDKFIALLTLESTREKVALLAQINPEGTQAESTIEI